MLTYVAPHLPQIFRHLDAEVREELISCAMPVHVVAGHDLFKEGDPADAFYVLQEGNECCGNGTLPAPASLTEVRLGCDGGYENNDAF